MISCSFARGEFDRQSAGKMPAAEHLLFFYWQLLRSVFRVDLMLGLHTPWRYIEQSGNQHKAEQRRNNIF
jgi:hypothetical protein